MARRVGVTINTTTYGSFKGADFSTDPSLVDKKRSPLCTNMVADAGHMPEKRLGWRVLQSLGDAAVHGLFAGVFDGETQFLAHVGTTLYLWDETDAAPVSLMTELPDSASAGVSLGGALWIVTGGAYIKYDGTEAKAASDGAYIPTTVITRDPTGGGTSYENLNLIQPYRKNAFQTDGAATAFQLDGTNLDTKVAVGAAGIPDTTACYFKSGTAYFNFTASQAYAEGDVLDFDFDALTVTCGEATEVLTEGVSGTGADILTLGALTDACAVSAWVWDVKKTEGTDFTVDRAAGILTFTAAPAAPAAGSADGLVVQFPVTVAGYADMVNKCRIITTFGVGTSDRVVISGNPDYPNRDWTSGLLDPSYIPDLSYATVGVEGVAVMGYCRLGEYLGIVKEDNGQDSTVFLRTAALDDDGNAVFTLKQAIAGVGAVSRGGFGTLVDEPLFLSGTGIYAISTSYWTGERVTQNRSVFLNPKLVHEGGLAAAAAVQWRGMFLLAAGDGHVYVLDGTQQKTYRSESLGDYVYEGYYWEDVPADCWLNWKAGADDALYFGTADGRICKMNSDIATMERFSDDGAAIACVWATKADDDGDATILKTMLKRGAAVTLKPYTRSSAKVCFRTDRDTVDYEATSDTLDIFDWSDIDFSRFTFDSNDGPREIFFNAKVKKYKRLQILIRNETVNEGFGVFAITKHYVEGNFAKR